MPSSNASSAEIDFVTALGRLLQRGALRDAFAADPRALADRLGVRPGDRPLFLQLVSADLEFQAQVLLRKRFDLVRRALPRTCQRLGSEAGREFLRFARATESTAKHDADGFCAHLARVRPAAVCPLERNRCRFVQSGRRCALRLALTAQERTRFRRPVLQLLLGGRRDRWHEWRVSIGF